VWFVGVVVFLFFFLVCCEFLVLGLLCICAVEVGCWLCFLFFGGVGGFYNFVGRSRRVFLIDADAHYGKKSGLEKNHLVGFANKGFGEEARIKEAEESSGEEAQYRKFRRESYHGQLHLDG